MHSLWSKMGSDPQEVLIAPHTQADFMLGGPEVTWRGLLLMLGLVLLVTAVRGVSLWLGRYPWPLDMLLVSRATATGKFEQRHLWVNQH